MGFLRFLKKKNKVLFVFKKTVVFLKMGFSQPCLEAFCSANTSFAVSLLMSQQLVRMGIQTNLYLRIIAPCNLLMECIHAVRSATHPIERTQEVFAVW